MDGKTFAAVRRATMIGVTELAVEAQRTDAAVSLLERREHLQPQTVRRYFECISRIQARRRAQRLAVLASLQYVEPSEVADLARALIVTSA